MRNCSKHLPRDVTNRHVEQYINRMQFSGYNREFRAQVVKFALQAFNTMLKKDADNEQPQYRPKGWRKFERVYAKRKKEKQLV